MTKLAALAALCSFALAQQSPSLLPAPASQEEADLGRAFQEANGSPLEMLHVIEEHLAADPESPYRPKLEHDAAQAAILLHDDGLVVRYGELSLARTSDDMKLLPAVTRSLLAMN